MTRWLGQTNKHDKVPKYHLEVFERCRRGTLMNRVETLRMSVVSFPTLFEFGSLQTNHSRKDIGLCETHLAERHRHTVLERRTRLGGHRIRLPASTFFSLSLSLSAYQLLYSPLTNPSFSANMSHVSLLLVRGSGERR